jgi:hypothetical protein
MIGLIPAMLAAFPLSSSRDLASSPLLVDLSGAFHDPKANDSPLRGNPVGTNDDSVSVSNRIPRRLVNICNEQNCSVPPRTHCHAYDMATVNDYIAIGLNYVVCPVCKAEPGFPCLRVGDLFVLNHLERIETAAVLTEKAGKPN